MDHTLLWIAVTSQEDPRRP